MRGRDSVAEDRLLAEMQALRQRIKGLTGTAVASRDGLIIREDIGDLDPDNLAALTATALAVSQRLASEAGQGTLRETLTRSTGGYVAVYAVGSSAVLVLIGDEGLDVTRLHRESRAAVDGIEALLTLMPRTWPKALFLRRRPWPLRRVCQKGQR
jgi:predicted regulator of Ras-like GTPase activity (Roadblock/LC7/MglB family)